MKRITRLAALLPFIMVAAACGTSDDDASSEAVETTVAETPSETTESAPETTAPAADSEVVEEPDAEVADDPVEEEEMVWLPNHGIFDPVEQFRCHHVHLQEPDRAHRPDQCQWPDVVRARFSRAEFLRASPATGRRLDLQVLILRVRPVKIGVSGTA